MASHQRRRLAIAVLHSLLPPAERDEICADLETEFRERVADRGRSAATLWLWAQLVRSVPALLARTIWRGLTGFDPKSNAMNPGGPRMERWILEARYAVRRLRTRPAYTILAVLTLALGVGGMATISGLVRSLLVNPLPYPSDSQLAHFWTPGDWSAREFVALRDQWSDFTAVAAYRSKDVTLEREGAPARLVPGIASSSELFTALGVKPLLGNGFAAGDDRQGGAAPVAVLSYTLWRELGGDASIVGSPVRLDGVSRTVIAVMPRGFWFPDPTIRVWIPDEIVADRQWGMYTLVGRVAPGRSVKGLQPAVDRASRILASLFTYSPQSDKTKNGVFTPLRDELIGGMRPALFTTLGGLAVILLIACANVAALVLSQVESRSTEMAVRAALGASRARLATQLMMELCVLGLLAGVVGSGVAVVSFDLLRGALPLGPWGERATLDWTLFAITMAVAMLAALGISVLPTMALWRGDLRLRISGARSGGVLRKGGGLQGTMVIGEVALAVLLTCGAGLLVRSVAKLYAIRPGFETRGTAVLDLAAPANMSTRDRHQMLQNLLGQIATLPGVSQVAVTQKLPLRGAGWTMGMRTVDERADLPSPYFRFVSPGYFAALGIPRRSGRLFDGSERQTDSVVSIVVNESLARIYFPGVDPTGRVIPGGFGHPERIIGVVADIAEGKLKDPPAPARYYLADQIDFVPDGETIVIHTSPPEYAPRILTAARQVIEKAAPSVAVQEATTMERVMDAAVGPARQLMTLLAFLTGLALLLGAIGVYGVMSQFVSRRRRDWSIRVALGLTPSQVIRLVVSHGMVLVTVGIALGVAASLVLARLLTTFLYGITAADPISLGAASALLFLVGITAGLVPALRAGRTDPALVLREQ